jgi:Fur family transcriptional regulator, ferric uptake regulator
LRRTGGRVALIAMMLHTGSRHLTVTELHDALHAQGWPIDLSAVHRATGVLTDRGLLHTLPTPGPIAYGLALPRHHHAICTNCETVIEISDKDPDAQLGSTAAQRMLQPFGFQPDPGSLAVRGRCRRCLDPMDTTA